MESLKEFIRQEHVMREGVPVEPPASAKIEPTKVKPSSSSSSVATVHVEGAMTVSAEMGNQSSRRSSGSIQPVGGSKSRGSDRQVLGVAAVEEEMGFIEKAMKKGVVYLLGEAEVVAEPKSSLFKKMVVNYAYSFLRKNFRQGENILEIPRTRLLRVGMTYEI